MSDISTKLHESIQRAGYSYGELAKLTGIPKSAIQRYATGQTPKIPLDRLQALADLVLQRLGVRILIHSSHLR